MLEHYFRRRKRLAEVKRNLLAPFLEEAAEHYRTEGYVHKYAQAALGYAASFGEWLRVHRVKLDRVTEEHLDGFLNWFVSASQEKSSKRTRVLAATRFVLGLIRAKYPVVPQLSPVEAEVRQYIEHLRRDRGLAEVTLEYHQRHLQQFLTSCFKQGSVDYSTITAARIHAYVDGLQHSTCNSRQRCACTALRGYFRFLQLQGVATGHLQSVVPTVRRPRTALSPKWPTSLDTDRLLSSVDRSRATGKRAYAVILCMAELGLRVGDVARLKLEDIDWREGTIRVPNHKRGRPYQLPLPRRLGQAIADYLAEGRPSSPRREVFLRHAHPRGTAVTPGALKREVRRAWQRAGLDTQFSGTHILRHSVATRMKQEGVSLKFIADVLGHDSVQTTTLYAQVDLPVLRTVAQPWPEVQS
jgi:site-specific recombinase XerD